MDKMKKIRPALNSMVNQIGLQWPVRYLIKADQKTCRIISEPTQKRHEVWFHSPVLEKFQSWKPLVAHEMCHAWLAENVDPVFSCMYFRKEYGLLTGEEASEFSHRAQMLYMAYCHVDIWVNVVRHHYWPELTPVEHQSFVGSLERLARHRQWAVLQQLENISAMGSTPG